MRQLWVNLQNNYRAEWGADGILAPDGTLKQFGAGLERVNVSFDGGGKTGAEGKKPVSIQLHYKTMVNGSLVDKNFTLGVFAYDMADGSARLAAKFTFERFRERGLLPADLNADLGENDANRYNIAGYCGVGTVDSCAKELAAVKEHLGLQGQPCAAHAVQLCIQNALRPKIHGGTREDSVVFSLLQRGQDAAKASSVGGGDATLYTRQKDAGVERPLSYADSVATRWGHYYRVACNLLLMRQFQTGHTSHMSTIGKMPFTEVEWAIIVQATAVLHLFAELLEKLQSTSLLIGEHAGVLSPPGGHPWATPLARRHTSSGAGAARAAPWGML